MVVDAVEAVKSYEDVSQLVLERSVLSVNRVVPLMDPLK
jgi:hypothetical protein